MDLRELSYFAAVYEERSVSAAARRCFISQPSVSAAVASLEHELGTKLFVRHRKGTTPTAAAERLYPMARRLVDDAAAVRAAFRPKAPETRPVRVGVMSSLDVERTRDLLTAMTRQPDLTLHVVPADAPCDLRVVSRALLAKDEAFVPLWSERYVVALPAAHPLALRAVLRASDLAGEKVVERCHCEHADLFVRGRAHVPVEVVAIAQSEEWAAALVGAGLGISLVPEGAVREGRGVVLRPLSDVKLSRDVGIAHPRRSVSSEVHRLLESVRRRFAA